MSEEIINWKFYNIEIGQLTRAGNLNISHSFICKSDKDYDSVNRFYSDKYKGFSIRVVEVTEVVQDEIPKVVPYDYSYKSPEVKEIENLKKEIKDLKEGGGVSFDRFSGELSRYDLPLEMKDHFKEFKEKLAGYNTLKQVVQEDLKAYIKDKYNKELSVNEIILEDFTPNTDTFKFTTRLYGKILPANNILQS